MLTDNWGFCTTIAVIWFTGEKEYQDQRSEVSNAVIIVVIFDYYSAMYVYI